VTPPPALPGSPADTVLTQVATDTALLPPGWSRVAATTAAYGSPYARACPSALPAGATGVASRFVSGRAAASTGSPSDVGVGLSLTVLPAGQATLAVDRLRTWVAACPGADGLDPTVVEGPSVAPLPGADAFVSRGGSGPAITWVVWARGDVLVAASVTGLSSTSGTWPGVVSAVDAVVQRRLRPVCGDLAPTAEDARRNPALPGYTPDPPAVALPSVTLPDPVAHPDLAPVEVPDRSLWVDTNGDGVGDTPPPASSAPRGSAPVFRDPEAIAVPDTLLTTAPLEPARPAVPPSSPSVAVPAVDAKGPGCGWAFSGATAPSFDEDAVAKAARAATDGALESAATAADTYRQQAEAWLTAQQAYLQDLASFTTWSRYDAALGEARRQLADAQSAYDASLVAYEAVVVAATPPTTPTTPPTSSPTTTPTTPTTPPTTPTTTPSSTSPGG